MSEEALTNLESEVGPASDRTADDQTSGGGSPPESVSNGLPHQDPVEAPYGFNQDGTPKKSRAGRPPKSGRPGLPVEDAARENVAQKVARLSRVRPKPQSEQPLTDDPPSIADAAPVRVGIDHVALGSQAAYLFMVTGSLALGSDFSPDMHPDGTFTQEGRTDFNAVRDSFANYFKAAGIDKIDPGWGLAIGLVAYTAKRAQKPTVRSKIGACFEWCKQKVTGGMSIFRRRST